MNSNMVKPEKFGHLHLVYHFTVPLSKHRFKFLLFKYLKTKCIFRRRRNNRKVHSGQDERSMWRCTILGIHFKFEKNLEGKLVVKTATCGRC